jgi:hypothetical protein
VLAQWDEERIVCGLPIYSRGKESRGHNSGGPSPPEDHAVLLAQDAEKR